MASARFIDRLRRLSALLVTNASGTVVGQLVMLITIPAQLRALGAEQFGLIVLFNSFVAAGALTDVGIGPTVLRFVALTHRHPRALQHVVASSLTVILLLSAVVATLGVGLGYVFSALRDGELVAGRISAPALAALIVIAIAASMCSGLGLNLLKGLRLYRAFAIAEMSQRIAIPVLTTLAAVLTRDVRIVLATGCLGLISSAVLLVWVGARLARIDLYLTTHLRYFRRRMLNFSRWIWVQAVFGYLGGQADRLIVAATMSLSALAVYAVAMSVANAMTAALSAGGSFLLPEASSRLGDKVWLTTTYVRFTQVFSAVSAVSIIAFLPLAESLLTLWVKSGITAQVLPMLLPLLWTVSSASASVPGTLIMNAMGHTRFAAVLGMVNNTVLLSFMCVAGFLYGLPGVIAAKLMSVPIGYAARAITARHVFAIPNAPWVALKMLWPTIAGALFVLPVSLYILT
jgi:O-antigen/teichoic acid export membrane protein